MIVFVHGVPEVAALWNKLRGKLSQESVALSLPGFGCARPAGFSATKDAYADWLAGELAAFDQPVDLVGHDWGAGITYRVVTTRPQLVRSWAADVANIMHPDYVWHDFAQIWQTPGDGEAFFQTQNAAPLDDRVALFEGFGMPRDDAATMAEAGDDTMASCILDLYRSATPNPYADWGAAWTRVAAPGLVIHPSDDPFGDDAGSRDMAARLGATVAVLPGSGHWWPVQSPEAGAAILTDFWAGLS